MNLRTLPLSLAISSALALNACSGGTSSSVPTSTNVSASSNIPAATSQRASGTLAIGIQQASTAANRRNVAYVSPSTRYATLWIDGAYETRQPCNAVLPCTLNWVSTSGPHTFTAEVDDSLSVGGAGNVLADTSHVFGLAAGENTFSMQLAGVPAQVAFVSENYNTAECLFQETCFLTADTVNDADGNVIPGGSYDNLGVCILEAGPGVTGCYGAASPFFNVQSTFSDIGCEDGTGSFSVSAESYQAYLNGPSAAEGELTTAELESFALTYPNQNSYSMIGWPAYSCANYQIYVNGPAQGGVTLLSHH